MKVKLRKTYLVLLRVREVMLVLGFQSLQRRWTILLKPNFGEKHVETQATPASQPPPPQGKINIGTMDVSDSDSEEEGQVSKILL